jgi:hypothetical protein
LFDPKDAVDFDGVEFESSGVPRPSAWRHAEHLSAARRELRWFHLQAHGRVPAHGEAPRSDVVAASRIARWLSELQPSHRGAFVVRYDGRRWPARLVRELGGLTSVVVRFGAMARRRGPGETLAEAEEAVVQRLLADIAALGGPPDLTPGGAIVTDATRRELQRFRRAARNYVRRAERAYLEARGDEPCAVADVPRSAK